MAGAHGHLENGAMSLASFFFIFIILKGGWVLKQEIKILYV